MASRAATLIALSALGTAVLAVLALVWTVRGAVPVLRTGWSSEELQILWQLDADWSNETMMENRARAASALLQERYDPAVDKILRFLDEVSYVVRKYSVDPELIWYRFYWPAACYWRASEVLRQKAAKAAGERYPHLNWLVAAVGVVEQRRTGKGPAVGPTSDQIRDFLLEEARGGSCGTEEEESIDEPVQMTPL